MRTPLYEIHQQLKARMIDFNGWEMPVQYPSGIIAEHNAVRENCGIFDTCHMGEFYVTAPNVRGVLNQLLTGDFSKLGDGKMRYSFITNVNGGVIDDAVVFLFSAERAMICVNAGDIAGDFSALQQNLPAEAKLIDHSAQTGKLDLQGKTAPTIVEKLLGFDFRVMPFYSFREMKWNNITLIISRSGYTGSAGVEIFIDTAHVAKLWSLAIDAGAKPCGLGARDTLRLEAGLPLYGHELNSDLNPLNAGFARFVALDKPENFCGKSALQKNNATARVLRGLKINDKRVPRNGFIVKDTNEKAIGIITSGAPLPTVGYNAALAYLDINNANIGDHVLIDIRGKNITATIVDIPFYRDETLRAKI